MKTLAKNFKCLAFPKCFLPMTYQKSGRMVAYVMLVMLIAVLLIHALPLYFGETVPGMIESIETELPDFHYEDGHLTFGSGEEYLWQDSQSLFYICTAVESFSPYYDEENFYGNYIDPTIIQNGLPQQAIFISSTDYIFVDYGSAVRMSLDELMTEFDVSSFTKAQFLETMSSVMYIVLTIGLIIILIGGIIGIFFFALIWGLIAFLINRSQKIQYSYGRMYRLAVYVMVPMRILKMLLTRFLPLPGSLISWTFTGIILVYLILALFRDKEQRLDKAF